MDSKLFINFVSEFFENMETDIEEILKKQKVKKLSVKKLNIEVIDYLNGSSTPVIDTVKLGDESLEIFIGNASTKPYEIEDIFHPYSLAGLADNLIGEEKYAPILKNFYLDTENFLVEFFNSSDKSDVRFKDDSYDILDLGFEILALSCITDRNSLQPCSYSLVEGVLKDIFINEGLIYFTIRDEHGKDFISIANECQASDLVTALNSIFNN